MRSLKKYLITLGVGLLVVLCVALSKDIFAETDLARVTVILYDGFFVAGAVLLAAGLLVYTSNEGVYDMVVYGFNSMADRFSKNGIKRFESFYDYRTYREGKKIPCLHLFACGGILLAVALILRWFIPAV